MTNPLDDTHRKFPALKAKQREIRDGFPGDLGLRVHHTLSWLQRAEMAGDDHDAAFIFYWIAFNAAYADELRDPDLEGERSVFADYFQRLTDLDRDRRIYEAIWQRFSQEIRLLLRNKFVFQPFGATRTASRATRPGRRATGNRCATALASSPCWYRCSST